jgi:hypothetical protein
VVSEGPFHIVITTMTITLVRWPGADWRDLQDHFDDFVTSFGPLDEDDARDIIDAEWPDLAQLKATALTDFFNGGAAQIRL